MAKQEAYTPCWFQSEVEARHDCEALQFRLKAYVYDSSDSYWEVPDIIDVIWRTSREKTWKLFGLASSRMQQVCSTLDLDWDAQIEPSTRQRKRRGEPIRKKTRQETTLSSIGLLLLAANNIRHSGKMCFRKCWATLARGILMKLIDIRHYSKAG